MAIKSMISVHKEYRKQKASEAGIGRMHSSREKERKRPRGRDDLARNKMSANRCKRYFIHNFPVQTI